MSHNEPTQKEISRMKDRFFPREVMLQGNKGRDLGYFTYKNVGSYAYANSNSQTSTD